MGQVAACCGKPLEKLRAFLTELGEHRAVHPALVAPADRLGTRGMLWLHLTILLPGSKVTNPKGILCFSEVICLKELVNELCHGKESANCCKLKKKTQTNKKAIIKKPPRKI